MPTDHLPWAEPVTSLLEGGVSGFGLWSVPLQGSQVLVYFEEGNIMYPMYMASLPGKPNWSSKGMSTFGFYDPNEEYPIDSKIFPHKPNQKNEKDIHKLATNESISDTIVQSKKDKKDIGIIQANNNYWDEPDPYYNAKYPDNIVLATHSGITIEIDNTEGSERIHIYHPSNSYVEIDKEGNMIVRNAKDKFEIVDGNKKEHYRKDFDNTVEKNRTVYVKQNTKEKIGINKKEYVGLNKDVKVMGVETKAVYRMYTLNSPIIKLNCTVNEPNV